MTVAADNPARPVPTPAPMAATIYQKYSMIITCTFLSFYMLNFCMDSRDKVSANAVDSHAALRVIYTELS
ncbi:MAG: hypothetical protein LIO76_01070 [Clostridiales bacterium]|nr:hypothetical protein [Clostridiales bacterium]